MIKTFDMQQDKNRLDYIKIQKSVAVEWEKREKMGDRRDKKNSKITEIRPERYAKIAMNTKWLFI